MSSSSAEISGKRFPWNIDYTSLCDQCGRWRAQGSHMKCSRQRQLMNAHLRKQRPK
jgi:hypothetical protein